jgi:hypothetical protein
MPTAAIETAEATTFQPLRWSYFVAGFFAMKTDQLPLQTTVGDTEIEAVHYESNGNIFSYKINILDGSAVYEYASPAGKDSTGEMAYATSLALGECKKLDPKKKLF